MTSDIMMEIEEENGRIDANMSIIRNAVKEFRKCMGLPMMSMLKCDKKLHEGLLKEEADEYNVATRKSERADALADILVVAMGWHLDGFPPFEIRELYLQLERIAKHHGIVLMNAFKIVHASNMSKLCNGESEKNMTKIMHEKTDVDVEFNEVGENIWACVCSKDSVRSDGKQIPKGKGLKSISFEEPDWKGDKSWLVGRVS